MSSDVVRQGIARAAPGLQTLEVPNDSTATGDVWGVLGISKGSGQSGHGVVGKTLSTAGGASGVRGEAPQSSGGAACGVSGESWSSAGIGVLGTARYTGVQGRSHATSGLTRGVYGIANSAEGAGVYGLNNSAGWGAAGVYGHTNGGGGAAGVHGFARNSGAAGVLAENTGGGYAFWGSSASGVGLKIKAGGANLLAEFRDSSGSENLRLKITRDGTVYSDGPHRGTGADFAEMYPAAGSLPPGTVVGIGEDGRLEPAISERARAVMGVVSADPSVVGGAAIEAGGVVRGGERPRTAHGPGGSPGRRWKTGIVAVSPAAASGAR